MVRCRGQEPTGPGFPSRVRARTKLRCCRTPLRTTRLRGPVLDAVQLLPKNVHHRSSGIFAPGKPLCRFPDLFVPGPLDYVLDRGRVPLTPPRRGHHQIFQHDATAARCVQHFVADWCERWLDLTLRRGRWTAAHFGLHHRRLVKASRVICRDCGDVHTLSTLLRALDERHERAKFDRVPWGGVRASEPDRIRHEPR